MFMETVDEFDLKRDMPKYTANPKAKEWDKLMKTFQTNMPGQAPDSTWIEMKEICANDMGK